ncbi:hypothetical protein Ancab_019418 [Ancistrocladus abbreviatus]
MRGVQLSLNQTQRLRLQRALQKLESLSSTANSNASVTVADIIPVNQEDRGRGHGTSEMDSQVVATSCGVVERVNKLVYVRSLRSRYKPETEDIIVGRVVERAEPWVCSPITLTDRFLYEIATIFECQTKFMYATSSSGKRGEFGLEGPDSVQFVDVQCHWSWGLKGNWSWLICKCVIQVLTMLSIAFARGGELQWMNKMCETYLKRMMSYGLAEVCNVQRDGTLQLQVRSEKYEKLERGQLLIVPPYLVKRWKQHFHQTEQYVVALVRGCNGFIWVAEYIEARDNIIEEQLNKSQQGMQNPVFKRVK